MNSKNKKDKYWVVIRISTFLGNIFMMSKRRLTREQIEELFSINFSINLNDYGFPFEEDRRIIGEAFSTTSKQKAEEVLKYAEEHNELPLPFAISGGDAE